MLVKELAGGEIEGEIRDIYPDPVEKPRVVLPYKKIYSLTGKEIPEETIKKFFTAWRLKLKMKRRLNSRCVFLLTGLMLHEMWM